MLLLLQGVFFFVVGLPTLSRYRLEFVQEVIPVKYWSVFVGGGLTLVFFLLCNGVWAQFQNNNQTWYVRLSTAAGTLTASNVLYWGAHLTQNALQQSGLLLEWGWLSIYDQEVINRKRQLYLEVQTQVYTLALNLLQVPSQVDHLQKLSLQGCNNFSSRELAGYTPAELTQQATHTARQTIIEHMQSAPVMTLFEKIKFVYPSSLVQWVTDHLLVVGLGSVFGLGLFGVGTCAVLQWGVNFFGNKLHYFCFRHLYSFISVVFTQGVNTSADLQLVVVPDENTWWWGLAFQISALITSVITMGKLVNGELWNTSGTCLAKILTTELTERERFPIIKLIWLILSSIETSSENRIEQARKIYHIVKQHLGWWWSK